MNRSARSLVKLLEQKGFELKRSRGSHQIYHNAATGKTVVVPTHGSRDMPKGTYFAILRQAGIDRREL